MPEILLEGDEPSAIPAAIHGQTQRHEELALPSAYGTGKLLLAAREPHWLYAWWDLTAQQQRDFNVCSAEGHLTVRVHAPAIQQQPVSESPVHPESRHWFIHVERAGTEYVAELGYYAPKHEWVPITTSTPAKTPPAAVSTDQTLIFATIPAQERPTEAPARATQAMPVAAPPGEAAHERALIEMAGWRAEQPGETSSAALAELARGQAEAEVSSAQVSSLAPLQGEAGGVSSPMGEAEQPSLGFWFSVNADLVIYGATEPDATVTIGGQPVSLRSDGTFNCRFALPDGAHAVIVSAMSAAGELRQAKLHFSRHTEHHGEVAAAPQDPSLKPPRQEPEGV